MLATRSSPLRVTKSPQGEGRDNPLRLRNFLKSLAKDTTRLTYQKYRQSKNAKSHSEPIKGTEPSKHEVRGPFLPLLPLPLPDPDPDPQEDTKGDCSPVPNEAVELQVSRPPDRRRSRSPKVLKVYSKAQRSPPLRNARPGRDGDDHTLNEANPASCEKPDNVITRSLARKREKGAEPGLAEDGDLIANQSLPWKRKRPRRLQVSGLALARTILSPTVSEDDFEKKPYLDQLDVSDTMEPPETQTSPQVPNQQKANIQKARRPKSVSQIRTSLRVPAPERICSEDFIFPTTPATPQKTRSLDWTPGSGFAGLHLESMSRKLPMKRSRQRDRRSDPIYVGQLKVKKVLALTHLDDDSPTTRRTRLMRKKFSNEGTAPFSENAATARNLLDLATHSSTDKVPRRHVPSSYLEAFNCQNGRFTQLSCDKAAALGAKVAGEPDPREELVDDNQDAMGTVEENGLQAEDDKFKVEADKEPVTQRIQSGLPTSTQTESRNDGSPKRQDGRGYDSKTNNAAPSFPYFEYLHPPSSVLQAPTSHPLEQTHVSSQAEHHKSSEEVSSEADSEMLECDGCSTPPQPIPQRVHQTSQNDQPPTAEHNLQPPSLFASQLSPRNMTPGSQPTDPRARLEITDSQPASIPPPTPLRFSAQPSTPPSKQTPNPALLRRRTGAKYRSPNDLPHYGPRCLHPRHS